MFSHQCFALVGLCVAAAVAGVFNCDVSNAAAWAVGRLTVWFGSVILPLWLSLDKWLESAGTKRFHVMCMNTLQEKQIQTVAGHFLITTAYMCVCLCVQICVII